jgi:acyl-CoA thioester hydrolase
VAAASDAAGARALPEREQFAHWLQMPVRWADVDSLGHVNNAKFFTYGEDGRIAYFEDYARRDPRFWQDYGLILARTSCDFLQQLRYPGAVEIGTRVARIGGSSLLVLTAVFAGDAAVASLETVAVWFDYRNQTKAAVPPVVREWIRGREKVAPQE